MTPAQAKKIVLARFPDATVSAVQYSDDWEITANLMTGESTQYIQFPEAATPDKAWISAGKQLSLQGPMSFNAIVIWRFHQAPRKFQSLSFHGGDETWIAWQPDRFQDEGAWRLDNALGNSVSTHPIAGGVIKIGAH